MLVVYFKANHLQCIYTMYKPYCRSWVVIFEAHFGCHDDLSLGKSLLKYKLCPEMAIAVWTLVSISIQTKQTIFKHILDVMTS